MAELLLPVRLGTTEHIDLATPFDLVSDKIDGVLVTSGMRILVKSQTSRVQNGVYVVGSNGILTRASDFALSASVVCGTGVFIQEGLTLENTGWVVNIFTDSSATSLVVGTDEIFFERFSINQNVASNDVASALVLRSVKGYPLTIAELDNNFKWLALSIEGKLGTADYTAASVVDRINSIDSETANLDVWKLQGLVPTTTIEITPTIAIRDENGVITASTFSGDLSGNATSSDVANYATLASNVDGLVSISNGGTGAQTASDARANLGALGVSGTESMTGKLKLAASSSELTSIRITPGSSEPFDGPQTILENGDMWANSDNIRFYLNGKKHSVAVLDSPEFSGSPTVPIQSKTANNGTIAATAFVQAHVADINAALDLKANLNSPTLTGAPLTTTASTSENSARIASTAYVVNRISSTISNYYTKAEILAQNAVIAQQWGAADNLIKNDVAELRLSDISIQDNIDALTTAVSLKAPLASPAFSGAPTAPTAPTSDNSGRIASTEFVANKISASNTNFYTKVEIDASNALITQSRIAGDAGLQTQINAIKTDVSSLQLNGADLSAALALKAPIASPAFTGSPTTTTATTNDNSNRIASTAFVTSKIAAQTSNFYTKPEIDATTDLITQARVDGDTSLQEQVNALKQAAGVPIGTVIYYAANAVPSGFLPCDGRSLSNVTYSALFSVIGYSYGGSSGSFKLPDLRGEFIRGFDAGRGVDANRIFGSSQKGSLIGYDESFDHVWNLSTTSDGITSSADLGMDPFVKSEYPTARITGAMYNSTKDLASNTSSSGWVGVSRPRNIALVACIKAFGSISGTEQIDAIEVLSSIQNKVNRNGDTMTGALSLYNNPSSPMHAATKQYVDDKQEMWGSSRKFVQSTEPLTAVDGDFWFKI